MAPDPDRRDRRSTSRSPQPGFSETFEADSATVHQERGRGGREVEVNGQDARPLGRTTASLEQNYTLKVRQLRLAESAIRPAALTLLGAAEALQYNSVRRRCRLH